MSKLTLITEGGYAKALYFVHNGVYPSVLALTIESFLPRVKYLTEQDDILLVINGFTDFRTSEVYSLIMEFERQMDFWEESGRDNFPAFTIVSNMLLGSVSLPYYYYKGDLFYGQMWKVVGGRLTEVTGADEATPKRKRGKNINNSADIFSLNGVMAGYHKYNQVALDATIIGEPVVGTESPKEENREYAEGMAMSERVINVNRFNK